MIFAVTSERQSRCETKDEVGKVGKIAGQRLPGSHSGAKIDAPL
jgi:hypothetical protein